MEAVQVVWELCLYKRDDQLEKNKKLLEAEIDAGEGAVHDEVGDSSDSSSAKLLEDELGDVSTPRRKG